MEDSDRRQEVGSGAFINQQSTAVSLLRRAANLLDSSNANVVASNTCTNRPLNQSRVQDTSRSISEATRAIFAPYGHRNRANQPSGSALNQQRRKRQNVPVAYWTHKFCVLSNTTQDVVPNREEKHILFKADLGEKKITFVKSEDTDEFKRTLEKKFPKLEGCGGYELLRTPPSSRSNLEKIRMPTDGFSSQFLSDDSNLGQAVCYIRPIQKDLDLSETVHSGDGVQELCLTCNAMIPLNHLREHLMLCAPKGEDLEDDLPRFPKKRKTEQQPVCQYLCETASYSQTNKKPIATVVENSSHASYEMKLSENDRNSKESEIKKVYNTCPICFDLFPEAELESHAAACVSEEIDPPKAAAVPPEIPEEMSYEEQISLKKDELQNEWEISVIRRVLIKTAMKELESAKETDWQSKIKTEFIGEEGVDSGGLSREFFSLLFKNTPVFESGSLSLVSEMLEKKHYFLIGRATAMGLLHGHPGPRKLNDYLVTYILEGKEPECSLDELSQLREDAAECVREIDSVTGDSCSYDVTEKYAEILEASGFRKILNQESKEEASRAVIKHFTFFRCLPSLLQFMNGLKLHGILELLQKHPADGKRILGNSSIPNYQEVKNFFKPVYSSDNAKKELEEMIIFNFGQFLKNVEREKIKTDWLDLDNDSTHKDIVVNMKHVLQALVGSEHLPTDLESGIIIFDHDSSELSTTNICAPSITITQIEKNQNYVDLENNFLNIIFRTDGFGMA